MKEEKEIRPVPSASEGEVKEAADHVLKKYDKTFRDLGKHETPDWEAEGWKTALRKIILDNYILETYANEKQGDRLYEMLEAFFARTRAEARLERDAEILATISKPYTAANALMNEHREGWNAALKRVRSLLNGS